MAHPRAGYEEIAGQIEQADKPGLTPLVCLECGVLVAADKTGLHDTFHKVKQ